MKLKYLLVFLMLFGFVLMTSFAEQKIDIPQGYIMIGEERFSRSLTELDLSGRNLSDEDIVVLRHMTDLTWLDLHNNQLRDIAPLAALTDLYYPAVMTSPLLFMTKLSVKHAAKHAKVAIKWSGFLLNMLSLLTSRYLEFVEVFNF